MELKMLEMNKIVTNPLQPRQEFDREKLQELANSIKEGDLLQPIVVRKSENGYEIVVGERRYKAFQILKEPKIPAIIREIKDDTDALEKSLIENLQRDDLTSVERENAIMDLWKSKRYTTKDILSKKLGIANSRITEIIYAKEARDKYSAAETLSTRTLTDTSGLSDEPRKKLLESISDKKIKSEDVRDVVRKVKQFPEPEQQMEILEEFEEQEDMSREIFDDIIRKKKEIVDGERDSEHIIQIETDSDKRMIQDYYDIESRVHEIYSDHINHFKTDKAKQEAINILNNIIVYCTKQLGEITDEKKET